MKSNAGLEQAMNTRLHSRRDSGMDIWLTSLKTSTPQEGFELAIKLSRMGVKYTQPDMEVLEKLRPEYATDSDGLTAASHVVALNFQTVAEANGYWHDSDEVPTSQP